MSYTPHEKILEKYADILINFALNSGKGVKKGETVYIVCPEIAKPLLIEVQKAVWKSGGNVITDYKVSTDTIYNPDKDFYQLAGDKQLSYFPKKYFRGLVDEIDHLVAVIAETNPQGLKDIDTKKLIKRKKALKPFQDWRFQKEAKGKLTWTLALYGTEAMAKEARLPLKEYWNQIIKACYLDTPNPLENWTTINKDLSKLTKKLTVRKIEKVHVEGPDCNIWIQLGENRQWLGGSGRNIPSFEVFTSPNWKGTNGWMRFNLPLYWQGNLIEDIKLVFKEGRVVEAKARKNEKLLKAIVSIKNADKIGEFSLTDRRYSRITKFMAHTLYDENIGGDEGNTHIALGMAYKEGVQGNPSSFTKEDLKRWGVNDSAIHIDIISTSARTVTAYYKDKNPEVIYTRGEFTL